MRIDQCFRNRKTEAETSKTAGDRDLSLLEGVEDFVDLFRLDTDASIGNLNFNLFRHRVARFDDDATLGRREFHAVLDEIPKELLQTGRISFDVRALGAESKFRLETLASDLFPTNFVGPLQDFVHANNLETQLQLASCDPRHVEQIVN